MTRRSPGKTRDHETPAAAVDDATPGRGEVVIFPGLNLRWLPAVLDLRRRRGHAHKDAPTAEE